MLPEHIKRLKKAYERWRRERTKASGEAYEQELLRAAEIERLRRRLNGISYVVSQH